MNKIIRAELKKTVSKPGIYILAVLLALIMVLGVFIYKPTNQNQVETNFSGTTVLQLYQNDFGEGGVAGLRAKADKQVEDAKNSIINYKIDNVSYSEKITQLKNQFETSFNAYNSYANLTVTVEEYVAQARKKMLSDFKSLHDTIDEALNLSADGSYPVITTIENYDTFDENYNGAVTLLSTNTTNKNRINEICEEYKNSYKPQIEQCLDNLYFPTFGDEKTKQYTSNVEGTKYNKFSTNLNQTLTEIQTLRNLAQSSQDENVSSENLEKMKGLINTYLNRCDTYANLIKYELLSNALNTAKSSDKGKLLYLNSTSIDVNAMLIKYNYLFDHNKNMSDFANPLTIGVSSNEKTNGYDYAYFILKMFSFIIIAYAIMAGAHTIAGEIKEGTMRYLAIRPIKRTSIVLGKMFAIAIMSLILVVFSGIISVVVGGCIYGFGSATILTVFAGKYAITLHPISMIAIYLLSLMLEIMVYLSIAILFSCFIKSDILAVTILMAIYLVNILLPMFSTSSISWLAYYPFSHISLYSLFGSSILATSNNMFNLLLGAKVYSTTSFGLTIFMILFIVIVCNVIATQLFKRKEI